ncbi:unnamed protein product [Amoebophrya sp. A25]|nr:unnamed protein product [Amoebophrya sp. A25]|eukprot:GSA25T00004713001.1
MRFSSVLVSALFGACVEARLVLQKGPSKRLAMLQMKEKLNPGEIAEVLRAKTNSAKAMVNPAELPVACQAVQCANIADICPLDIVWKQGACCPVCQTEGYEPGMTPVTDEYLVEMWQGADMTSCNNVKCFRLQCPPGEAPAAPSGGCCKVCKKKL